MILTDNVWSQAHPYTPSHYLPARPSPLSPRSANACPRPLFTMSEKPTDTKPLPFSKRLVKANPLLRGRDENTKKRRDLFLKKVGKDRDDKRFEARGDQILHLDFRSERQRWEAELEQSAPSLDSSDTEEDQDDLPVFSGQQSASPPFATLHTDRRMNDAQTTDEADAVLEQEDRELEALLALMEDDHMPMDQEASQHFGSDDEDYDTLFMDLVAEPRNLGKDLGSMAMNDEGTDEVMDES